MAWFKKHRNESVDQFSSLWGSLSAQDPGGDESYVSISSEVTSASEDNCTVTDAGPSSAPAIKMARPDSQNASPRRAVASTMEAAARCLGLDHSTRPRALTSWAIFLLLGVLLPLLLLACTKGKNQSCMALTVLSEMALAAVSFNFARCSPSKPSGVGLQGFLQLDSVAAEALSVQQSYKKELRRAPQLFFLILLPTSALKLVEAVAWHVNVGFFAIDSSLLRTDLLLLPLLRTIAWSYRVGIYLWVCVLFLLRTSLQAARVQAYCDDLGDEVQIVKEHFKLRDQMAAISHAFRGFLLYSLLIICCSQASTLYSLLVMKSGLELSQACWLLLSSFIQLTGAGMCLHGAAQITHRAQRIVSIVSQWHAVATVGHYVPPAAYSQPCSPHSFAGSSRFSYARPREDSSLHDIRQLEGWGLKHPVQRRTDPCRGTIHPLRSAPSDGTAVDVDAIEHDARNFEANAFNKRQAIVTYLSHSPCGITMYGFALDRGFLYASFGFIFSIALFVVSRAIASR